MPRLGFFLVVCILFISLDWYALDGLSLIFGKSDFVTLIYWISSLFIFIGFYKVYIDIQRSRHKIRRPSTNLILGFGFAILIAKLIFVGLLIFQDFTRLLIGAILGLSSLINDSTFAFPARNSLITTISAILSSIPLLSMLYGITKGKYKYEIENINLTFHDLPKAFDGFRIVQISDIHAGSFDSLEQVQKGIEIINSQKADLVVFTGDLVNSHKNEIDPYVTSFSKLSAPFGKLSILGNHDYYGLYRVAQNDPQKRYQYMEDFISKQQQMGFQLLNNESHLIEKEGESIRIIGVENWGKGPFPKKGDLDKALQGVNQNEFSILLSHDPSHWDYHVLPHSKKIHLTLSGHTHGLQFGINLGSFKWSPVKYRYPRWMGLYEKENQFLYVNRGFGFLAWPGRVGMTPEITVIELTSSKAS
ncbi:MAG: metallophosphoesterase [Saprospiraceae bacterium]|nr:metallophosphoesterase [Saprospiraceae bacterium]